MEIVVVGLAIAAIVIAAKFCAWVIETVGLPVLITAAVGFFIHNRCCLRTCAIVCGLTFIVTLLSVKK